MKCPACQIKIPRDAINIQKDIAQCQSCGNIFSVSSHIHPQKTSSNDYDMARQAMYAEADHYNQSLQDTFEGKGLQAFDINSPPKGAYINHLKDGVQIGATTRSWMALFLVPFSLVWSGGSLGGIYGSQILSGEFEILISLFGIPFLLGSVLLWSITIMSIFGKVEVTLDSDGGHIFTGVGKIGQHQRFAWSEVNSVREDVSVSRTSKGGSSTNHYVALEGQRQVRFGNYLSSEHRYYFIKTLQKLMRR